MSKAAPPTKAQRARWQILRDHGCIICGQSYPSIHHLFTGGGGRKNHDKVAALCHYHHQGEQGIHTLSRKVFSERFMSEEKMQQKAERIAPL